MQQFPGGSCYNHSLVHKGRRFDISIAKMAGSFLITMECGDKKLLLPISDEVINEISSDTPVEGLKTLAEKFIKINDKFRVF